MPAPLTASARTLDGCSAPRLLPPMAAGDSSSSGASVAAAVAKLHDEAIATAKKLEDEATALQSSNAEHSQVLQEEADLLKSAIATQERVRAAVAALDTERA